MDSLRNSARELLLFLRHPQPEDSTHTGVERLRAAVVFGLISVSVSVIWVLATLMIRDRFSITSGPIDFTGIWVWLAPVVTFPVVEELMFRWPLGFRSGILVFALLPALVVPQTIAEMLGSALWAKVLTGSALLIGLALLLWGGRLINDQMQRRLFPWAFYCSAVLFGVIHLAGLKSEPGYYALAAVMLASHRIWSGLVFGFARIRYGLICSIVAHGVHNLVAVTLDTFIG